MLRWLMLILLVGLTTALVVMNWSAFVAPTSLWLGFMMVEAPLGLVMLGFLLFLALVAGTWVIYLQGTALLETRRHGRELQTQRDLADKAEASRFAELSRLMTSEFQRLGQSVDTGQAGTQARIAQAEQRLGERLDQSANAVQASLGELDDRLERREATSGVTGGTLDPLLPRS